MRDLFVYIIEAYLRIFMLYKQIIFLAFCLVFFVVDVAAAIQKKKYQKLFFLVKLLYQSSE